MNLVLLLLSRLSVAAHCMATRWQFTALTLHVHSNISKQRRWIIFETRCSLFPAAGAHKTKKSFVLYFGVATVHCPRTLDVLSPTSNKNIILYTAYSSAKLFPLPHFGAAFDLSHAIDELIVVK